MKHEPGLGAAVARPADHFVMPLQQTVGVGHRAGLLGRQRGRHQEDLGANIARVDFAVSHRAPGIPERCRLGFGHVAHDKPIEFGQSTLHEARIMAADSRVLAEHEHPANDAVAHRQCHRQLRMVADDARHPAIAEVVVRSGGIAVIRLQ